MTVTANGGFSQNLLPVTQDREAQATVTAQMSQTLPGLIKVPATSVLLPGIQQTFEASLGPLSFTGAGAAVSASSATTT